DGVTVFLTTQYLEEADVLADRVGIIDRGRIVAEGTPEALKDEIGRPSVEVVPADRADRDRVAGVLAEFGSEAPAPPGAAAPRLGQLAGVMMITVIAGVTYLAVGLIAGVDFKSGVAGVAVMLVLFTLISLAFSAFGAFVGLRAGRAEAVQGFFPLFFVLLF